MSLLSSFKETTDFFGAPLSFVMSTGDYEITDMLISIRDIIQDFIQFILIILSTVSPYPFLLPRGVFMGFSGESVGSLERPLRVKEVVVYTSSGCSRCEMLKKWLKNKNADFEEKNVEDVGVMADLVMRNVVVLSAPALEVEGAVYTEDKIFDGDGLIETGLLEILKGR
jgi:glutaredoxin